MSFDAWKQAVDRIILQMCGMCSEDIPDVDYYGMYQCQDTPKEAAKYAVKNAMEV